MTDMGTMTRVGEIISNLNAICARSLERASKIEFADPSRNQDKTTPPPLRTLIGLPSSRHEVKRVVLLRQIGPLYAVLKMRLMCLLVSKRKFLSRGTCPGKAMSV